MTMDLYDCKGRLEGQIALIKRQENISSGNKQLILEFKDYLLSEGIGVAKIARYMVDARKLCVMLGIPVKQATESDVRKVIGQLEQTTLSPETKRCFKVFLRKFYRFLRGITRKGEYPPEVSWLSLSLSKNNKKLPEELISDVEAKEIIRAANNTRDKALISILADSGARVSEIGMMKIKHVSFETHGARLTIHGKTGTRKILVVYSAPYLRQWINLHPNNNNPECYLWSNHAGQLLCYTRIAKILKQTARKAGITKKIYPHLLRHSRATQLALFMSEAALKQYFGWTQSSKMASIYIHLSGKDTDNAILQANGIEVDNKPKKQLLKPIECIRCGTQNEITNRFCKTCSLPLYADEAQMTIHGDVKHMQATEILNNLLKDPEVLQLLARKLTSEPSQ